MVHHRFHYAVQGLRQFLLVHVVLVLAHANGLGIDLHQLRQRVLHAAGDGDGASDSDVIAGELLGGELGGGVYRRAGFAGDEVVHIGEMIFLNQRRRELLGLIGCGAVSDGEEGDVVLLHQSQDLLLGHGLLLGAVGDLQDAMSQHAAGGVHHRHLAARAVARVKAHDRVAGKRRLQEELLQVHTKNADGLGFGLLGEPASRFSFQCRK